MSGAPFRLAPLAAGHDRAAFNSDSGPLNRYLREQRAVANACAAQADMSGWTE